MNKLGEAPREPVAFFMWKCCRRSVACERAPFSCQSPCPTEMKEAIHSGQKIKAISKALVDTLRTKRVAPPKKVLIFSPACVLERVRKAKKRVAVPGVARRPG